MKPFYYIKVSGIPSGYKFIKAKSPHVRTSFLSAHVKISFLITFLNTGR